MTPQKAKIIFATHMQASRKRQLTAYELKQLSTARQVLRQTRKPAMNPKRHYSHEEGKRLCECGDSGCPVHKGKSYCTKPRTVNLTRPDMGGARVSMCEACASDALESGVFGIENRRKKVSPKSKVQRGAMITKSRARKNPPGVYMNYRVLRIEAVKTPGHLCDAECKKHGHRYFHDFKTSPKMFGLPDGSLLIKS